MAGRSVKKRDRRKARGHGVVSSGLHEIVETAGGFVFEGFKTRYVNVAVGMSFKGLDIFTDGGDGFDDRLHGGKDTRRG